MDRAPSITGRSLLLAAVLCAAALPASGARGAVLSVDPPSVTYVTQTATSATGTFEFNLRFDALDGDPGNYDFFTAQMMVTKILAGPSAVFTLDEPATEDTASIGPAYWLPAPPTPTFPNASTQGSELRFSDFVSIALGFTPSGGDIVAHYVIDFEITSAAQFGDYEIAAGAQAFNHFGSDLVNTFDNTITPATINLIPEASSGLLFGLATVALIRRRR